MREWSDDLLLTLKKQYKQGCDDERRFTIKALFHADSLEK